LEQPCRDSVVDFGAPRPWRPNVGASLGVFAPHFGAHVSIEGNSPCVKLPAVLSPGFVRALPQSERKKLGRAGLTPEECHKTFVRGQEIELQQLVANWLNLHGIYYEWDHTHKKTSGKLGRADFRICVPPRGLWLSAECKAAGESLSLEQATEAARLRNSGGRFVVVYSLGDLIEAIRRIEAA
jgi:hypothetical protein